MEAFYAARDKKAEEAFSEEESRFAPRPGSQWDTSGLSDDWGDDGPGMKAYCCPSCGGELICDSTTAATCCPYCGNNTIVPGQFAGSLKPDMILPFRVSKDAAVAALKQHCKDKWLLPKAFSQDNHLNKIQGIYVPFWLYDAQAEVDAHYHGIITTVNRTQDYVITNKDHYHIHRRGSIGFTGVPVDSSTKMDNNYMDSLEPFDYSQMEPFSTAYLPGYLADRFDQSVETCAGRADARCEQSALDAVRSTVLGYTEVRGTSHRVDIQRGKVRYALLPVWVLHTKWRETDYVFMMNGQTGKLVGDLPVDKRKSWLTTGGLTLLLTLLLQLTGIGPALAAMLSDFFAGG